MVNMRHNDAFLYRLHEVRRKKALIYMYNNLLSSSSMVTVVVDGFNMTPLSPAVLLRDTVKDSVTSSTILSIMGIITV